MGESKTSVVDEESKRSVIGSAVEDSEQLLGKVTVATYGGLLDSPKVKKPTIEKSSAPGSKRLKEDSERGQLVRVLETTKFVQRPPTDLELLSRTTLISSRLSKSIDIMAKNVVGLGFEVIDILTVEQMRNVDKQTVKEIEKQKDDLNEFLENANDNKTFDQLMTLVKVDEESLGNGYLEITRRNNQNIFGMGHMPGRSMRVRKDRPGFLQIRGDKVRFFAPFGSEVLIDPEDGSVLPEGTLRTLAATEIIHFKLEHPSDDFYGIPRWFSAIPAITGNRLADIRNIKFMENDATPRLAVLISGGNLDPSSVEAIEKFIDLQGKGVENASRVMVLQTERKMMGPQAGDPPKIELKPLTVGIEDDASFLKYRQANNDEIKEVFGIGDLFFGMTRDINRAAAAVAKQVTNEQEFEPERKRYSHTLKHILLPELSFDTDLVTIKFNSPVINDITSLADGISKTSAAGGLTPNDIKKMIGQPSYPKTPEFDWADYPIPIATLFIQLGLFGVTDEVDDTPERQPGNRKKKPSSNGEEAEEEETDEDNKDENKQKQIGIMAFAMKRLMKMNGVQGMVKKSIEDNMKILLSPMSDE